MPTDRDPPAPPFSKNGNLQNSSGGYVPDSRLDFIDRPPPDRPDCFQQNPPGGQLAYRGSQPK